jgi:integrase
LKQLHRLSARRVAIIIKAGGTAKRESDGGNLYVMGLHWTFMWRRAGRQREAGGGSLLDRSLAEAREWAAGCRAMLAKGIDPLDVKEAAATVAKAPKVPTFGECAEMVFVAKSPAWRSALHTRQWQSSIVRHAALIRDMPINEIDRQAVLTVLQPIWLTTQEPARRMRGRGEEIWDYAKVHGWVTGENPFRWKGNLEHILPRRQKVEQQHFAAMDYRALPAFVAYLRKEETPARLVLEFLILTAARSTEVREARWWEIDFEAKIWTVPADRMKAGLTHRIPLSSRAVEILKIMNARRIDGIGYVFPSTRPGRPISYRPLYALLPAPATLHGLRSTFRDWCGEETSFPREIAEGALAHATGNAVEAAYRRGGALEKRRVLMEAWASFCGGLSVGNVVLISKQRG